MKEKRISLRSFLRRGLVILSLLALAFASCSDSSSDDNTGPGTTDPGTPPPVVVPAIRSITILQQPQERSYQGMPPNLKGLIVEVLWMNGDQKVISEDENKDLFANLYGVPQYCDEAWNGEDGPYEGIALGYKGTTAVATNLKLPKVVRAETLEITQTKALDWYSDERPNFDGLTYNVTYQNDNFEPRTGGALGDPKNPYSRQSMPMTDAYPKVSYDANLPTHKRVDVSIGKDGGNVKTANFKIANYYQVLAVEFKEATYPTYFDDDLTVFFSGNSLDKVKVYNELTKSNVKFTVTYDGAGTKTKELTMPQFRANMEWYYNQPGLGSAGGTVSTFILEKIITTSDDRGFYDTQAGVNGKIPTYNFINEDVEDEWSVYLEYAPRNFNTSATIGVRVPITMYLFTGDILAQRKAQGSVIIRGSGSTTFAGRAASTDEVSAINTQWKLVGTYERTSARVPNQTRDIDITDRMLMDGFWGASVGSRVIRSQPKFGPMTNFAPATGEWGTNSLIENTVTPTLFWPNVSAYRNGNPADELVRNQIRRDFPLPVFYRGANLVDEDSILVNILRDE